MTIINCFTDVKPQGGGTFLAEDGIERLVQILHDHPEGLDPPYGYLFEHCRGLKRYVIESLAREGWYMCETKAEVNERLGKRPKPRLEI